MPTPAVLAADLFRRGFAPYIVVTGGVNRYTGTNEADTHHAILISEGVPSDHIIVENRSTNTLENVIFALPRIEAKIDFTLVKSMLVIAKWMHSRRVLMTLKRHTQRSIRYYAHTYEPEGITRENWPSNPRAESANVLKNWDGIPRYLALNHLEEISRDGDGYV